MSKRILKWNLKFKITDWNLSRRNQSINQSIKQTAIQFIKLEWQIVENWLLVIFEMTYWNLSEGYLIEKIRMINFQGLITDNILKCHIGTWVKPINQSAIKSINVVWYGIKEWLLIIFWNDRLESE